jgi:hypothetical protein
VLDEQEFTAQKRSILDEPTDLRDREDGAPRSPLIASG